MTGCERPTVQALFMCPIHWRKVPAPLQEAIWQTYREAGGSGGAIRNLRYQPYYEACANAIDAVAKTEGTTGENRYRRTANILAGVKP